MQVKDQIKVRREQLGVSVQELAKRLKVSAQAVRYWESGRSYPGKGKTAALEAALRFNIDWTEGARASAKQPTVQSMIAAGDVSLLLEIAKLPPPAKALIGDLVRMHLDALGAGGHALDDEATEVRLLRHFVEERGGQRHGRCLWKGGRVPREGLGGLHLTPRRRRRRVPGRRSSTTSRSSRSRRLPSRGSAPG